ncbi:RDD family protein [Pseudomonas sp. LPB0260]|uniref:RDD family protein n=1 Tax=Pseudomonas sp. LPB0260 TaxID=2614442 RepID=UPI0015C2C0AA|nr:RDD family protein [Pseudomonas sp. LPB0260]QLC74860.1 RDD family protein [Pseudomonas sp. LPB0260]
MSDNIYAPPQSVLVETVDKNDITASRWKRLGASLIDTLTIMIVTLPAMYFTGGFDRISEGVSPSTTYSLVMAALGLIIFFALNTRLLIKSGQTLGKKVVGIKIVDLDGDIPTFKKHLAKRYAVFFLPGQIPVAGQFISIVNILFIFGKQKRCAHDYIAGTKVIEC